VTHDDNGNTTNDGQFKYTFDAWNRLVGAWYAGGDTSVSGQRVATYAYDGLGRRTKKIRASSGDGVVYKSDSGATGIPAGDTTEHYYYTGWTIAEPHGGTDRQLRQHRRTLRV
jgi:YD repeat-containing protein